MDAQQIYDTVLFGLRKQGHASVDEEGSCRYRGPTGDKCAAGMLIPDEKYNPNMEELPVDVDRIWKALGLSEIHKPLVIKLQTLHDIYLISNICRWECCMATTARDFGLKYTPMEVE